MHGKPRLVLATRNSGKVREISAVYRGTGARLSGLDDWPELGDLPEEGETYAENAASKALTVARATGSPALADDSGVEIDALGGGPGVRSRRLLGEAASDEARNAYVLSQLTGLPASRRTARYRAVVAVATPDGRVETFEGVCEGAIAERPRGTGGFGYDPIFEIAGDGRTMAEVPLEVKNEISHRARALRAAQPAVARALARAGQEGSSTDANSRTSQS
ncbi:MAG TPA: RdgB/HAM1 family non-canonical purine NTP pyrophosphatase [bacterium]|nr:RdgB/HAM1 family non-canonical purine NTP pyrophosphatase [bacterium]